MTTCSECGKPVSSQAEKCPSCGARVKRKPFGCGAAIVIVGLVAFGASKISTIGSPDAPSRPAPPPAPNQEAAKPQENEPELVMASLLAKKIRESAHNPSTIQWTTIGVVIDPRGRKNETAYCFSYRGTNPLNATIKQETAILVTAGAIKEHHWNKVCAGKTARDITTMVKMVE